MLKRSILYVSRNLTRTLLLLAVFFLVTTFTLSGLAVMDASEDTSAELRGTTGASFRVERNLSTGSSNNMGNGMSFNTQEHISDAMLKEIASTDGIKAYNAQAGANLALYDSNNKPMEVVKYTSKWDAVGLNYTTSTLGSFFSEYDKYFLTHSFELTEGRHITDKDEQVIIISEDLAQKCNLSLGDKVKLYCESWTTGGTADDDYREVEVIGLFKVIEPQPERENTAPSYLLENYVFTDMKTLKELSDWVDFDSEREGYETADFYVNDPQQIESIIQNVHQIDSIDWNNFNITVNDEVYQRSASSMSNVESLIRTMIIMVIVISMGVITLILTMWIKGRMRETGILMAVGVSKIAVIIQHMFETAMIAIVSFAASWFAAPATAKMMGTIMNSKILSETIIVGTSDFLAVCGIGILLLLLSVLVSSLPIIRLKPREILSKMS